ncbi:hypothetical protein GQ43DRAFT_480778 [Delitschia confertaspora ATCC 74209]|uniref:Ubiquitin-like domain-containing protein n=1 Tax=Delitschia confertaspora ATCC 74209 TaxID=1513339 RepID=A0A9P4MSD8_9PLEO|nr:hypothetical protein GQ43DRAFT_480778 [Delitschia confertaspora ATCC 74209]
MTDEIKAAAAAPKKRTFFKRAAWQTAPKNEDQKDIFSHSRDYVDIVAREAQRKREAEEKKNREEDEKRQQKELERRIREEERRVKAEEEAYQHKRRKVSVELGDTPPISARRSGSFSDRTGKRSLRSSPTPLSPLHKQPSPHSLSARYETLTRSATAAAADSRKSTHIIELSDPSDSDSNTIDAFTKHQKPYSTVPKPVSSTKVFSDEPEEAEDPEFAALIAQARAKRKAEEAAKAAEEAIPDTALSPHNEHKDPIVSLFISSEIPSTKPLLVRIRISKTLGAPRQAWCQKQGFSNEDSRNVFLAWRGERVWDSTSIARLGVSVDSMGYVTVQGDSNMYTDDDPPRIHLQAFTEDLYIAWKRERAAQEEAEKRRAAATFLSHSHSHSLSYSPPFPSEPEPLLPHSPTSTIRPAPEKVKIGLVLKARGKKDFKIRVNSTTTFEHLTSAYRQSLQVPNSQPLSLYFDGERLRPMDCVGNTELEDMDTVEVHFN